MKTYIYLVIHMVRVSSGYTHIILYYSHWCIQLVIHMVRIVDKKGGQAQCRYVSSNKARKRADLMCCPRRLACPRRLCCCWAGQPRVPSGSAYPRVPSCPWCSWWQEASARHSAGLPVEVCFATAPWLQGPRDHVPCQRRQGSVMGAELRGQSQPSSLLGGVHDYT